MPLLNDLLALDKGGANPLLKLVNNFGLVETVFSNRQNIKKDTTEFRLATKLDNTKGLIKELEELISKVPNQESPLANLDFTEANKAFDQLDSEESIMLQVLLEGAWDQAAEQSQMAQKFVSEFLALQREYMKKSFEQEQLQLHMFFSTAWKSQEYHKKYNSEIFSPTAVFQSVSRIIEKDNDFTFSMLLGALKAERTAEGHQFHPDVAFPLVINCLYHLKILNYYRNSHSLKVEKAVLHQGKINLFKVAGHLRSNEDLSKKKYSKLFEHLAKEYKISPISIPGGAVEIIKTFSPENYLPKLDQEQQVRIEIFSALLTDYLIDMGNGILEPESHKQTYSLLQSEEGVKLKSNYLINKYSKAVKNLFKFLEQSKVVLPDGTITLVTEYLSFLLPTLTYNEIIDSCFSPEGKYPKTAKLLAKKNIFPLYEALSFSLARCEDFELVKSGVRVLDSFLDSKNEDLILDSENIKYSFHIYHNLGQTLHNLKFTAEGAKYLKFLITNYQAFKAVAEEDSTDGVDPYMDIIQNLINIYGLTEEQEALKGLKESIVKQKLPYADLFSVTIGIHLGEVDQGEARKLFAALHEKYGNTNTLILRNALKYIANFTEDKNIARNIKSELPLEQFNDLIAKEEFNEAIKLFEEFRGDIMKNNMLSYVRLVHAYLSLGNYAAIESVVDLIPDDNHKAHVYYVAARYSRDDNGEQKFGFIDKALSYRETSDAVLYNEIVYYGIICALKFKNEEYKDKYQELASSIDIEITNIWARSLFNSKYENHSDLIISLAQNNQKLIDEYYERLAALPTNEEKTIEWLVGDQKLSSKDADIKVISQEQTVIKYGYITPKVRNGVDNIQEYDIALESGIVPRAMGQDGVKPYYSNSKKAQGNCSGYKIKIGTDIEIYGHKVFEKIDDKGVKHQLCLFDHHGNHTDMQNYFDNHHQQVEIIGQID